MRVLLYADGDDQRGLGHVMRCVALAEEAVARGHEVRWCGVLGGSAIDVLSRLGTGRDQVHRLSESAAAAQLRALASDFAPDVLHVDSYDLAGLGDPHDWAALLSATQDLPNGVRPADLVVDANLGAEQRLAAAPPRARWTLPGLDFAPLRASIRAAAGVAGTSPDTRDVLVVMGGTDALGVVERVVRELALIAGPLRITVVAPPARHAAIRAAGEPHDVRAVSFVEDLGGLAAAHRLVVTAAGTSVWELCHVGVPIAALCVIDNQEPGYQALVSAGAAVGLGHISDLGKGSVAAALAGLVESEEVRAACIGRAAGLVDGYGAWRTVSAWESALRGFSLESRPFVDGPIALRPAGAADAQDLYDWRNDDETRRWSLSSDAVGWEDHREWLRESMAKPGRYLWIADGPGRVGVVRWDQRQRDHWEVSITVAPGARGRGLAGQILAAAESRLVQTLGRTPLLLATVQDENVPSARLFESAGYLPFLPSDDRGFAQYAKWSGSGDGRSLVRGQRC